MNSMTATAPHERQAVLTDHRNRKMAASVHAYVRGSTVQFYRWLARSDRVHVPEGPQIWICGDCHVGNLGPVASVDGRLEIQIRDLDQTVVGNPAHDLIRLGLSLAMAARGSDLPGVTTARMLEHLMSGYEQAFSAGSSDQADLMPVPRSVRDVMHAAGARSWKHLADERIEGTEPKIPLGKRFWPLQATEREALEVLFRVDNVRTLVSQLRSGGEGANSELIDAAYWRKGCSSLGRLRYAALVRVATDRGRKIRHCLVDLKEATTAVAPRAAATEMPPDDAQRVLQGARHLSPFLGQRMLAVRLLDRAFTIRELMPQDLKLELEHLDIDEATAVAGYLGSVVGKAHARQLDPAVRASWLDELGSNRSKSLDAPSWLWSSVVELIGAHESAYLEHCRRYAMEDRFAPSLSSAKRRPALAGV